MDSKQLKLLLQEKENLTLEFKEKYTPKIDEDIVAFSNTKGGIILLGVDDKGKVKGQELTNELKAKINTLARNCKPSINVKIIFIDKIIIIEILEGNEKPYSCSSGYYRRLDGNSQKMNTEELKLLFQKSDKVPYEEKFNKEITFEDISLKKVNAILNEAKMSVIDISIKDILYNLNATQDNQIKNVGVLFFAKEPRKFILQCEMILIAFKGKDKIHIYDRKDIKDDLLTQFNEAVLFLKKHLNVRSEIKGINRKDIYEIPFDALREAIANSIIHRDYSIRGTSLMVEVYDDRVEITNPGGLVQGLNKQNLGKISLRRNQLIADYFSRMNKVERIGSGIKRMKEAMQKENLRTPEIQVSELNSFFTIIFKRPFTAQVNTEKTMEKILIIIKDNPKITQKEISEKTGLTRRGIEWNLQQLKEKGIIKRIGPDKGGHWEIIK